MDEGNPIDQRVVQRLLERLSSLRGVLKLGLHVFFSSLTRELEWLLKQGLSARGDGVCAGVLACWGLGRCATLIQHQ